MSYNDVIFFIPQIPEPDVAIHSVDIDPDGAYLSAVNSKVCR